MTTTETTPAAEQQEMLPNRRAKFKGMSANEVDEQLPFGAEVELTVRGVVTGDGREIRKDGVVIHTSTITVETVKFTSVDEPKQDPELDFTDDDATET